MIKQKKWTLIRLIGLILICIGFIAVILATQGAGIVFDLISLIGLLGGFCTFTYGLVAAWWNK